jgi:hypothetical protein
MSSTRKAQDGSVLHQCGFSSSTGYERGLIANLVAKRCAVLATPADRDLVWFIQYLSHQPGSLVAVAAGLLNNYSNRLGTRSMVAAGKKGGQKYDAEEMRKIRRELPTLLRRKFPLCGETNREIGTLAHYAQIEADRARLIWDNPAGEDSELIRECPKIIERAREAAAEKAIDLEHAEKYPSSYSVEDLQCVCRRGAELGPGIEANTLDLEKELGRLCLDPACDPQGDGPWYFADLFNVLREYKAQWTASQSQGATTAVVRKVHETLEYTVEAAILSLLAGNAILGQSFAAERWCAAHPYRARICDVPASNDEASFYRAIAKAVGLGNFLNYKNVQIRERVEFFMQTSGICLVLNHAENLWPQKNLREAFPGRLAWLFAQVAKGASACMISGPQFFMQQRTCEKIGWNSPEFRKKIPHLDRLPDSLSVEDMTAIARVMLPEADTKVQEAVAIYAVGQQRDLEGLKNVSKRAQVLAQREGRTQRTSQDIISALKFVGGSDKLLREAFIPAPSSSRQVIPAEPIEHGKPVTRGPGTIAPPPPSFTHRSESVEPINPQKVWM